MDVLEAVASRYSCRAFLPTPVPEKIVRDIVERAARAPSAGNMQPWRVYAHRRQAGRGIESAAGAAHGDRTAERRGHRLHDLSGAADRALSRPAASRSASCSTSRSVCREKTSRRAIRQYSRNYQFFGAPVALFFAREKAHGPAQWADIGGYLQTVALLARGFGLHTCPQQAWVSFHRTVRVFLNLPDHLMIYSGMAVGYEDAAAPINSWRSPREPLDHFASFDGFET